MPAIMTMLADHAARQLLDFNQKLDINLLDNVVNCLYHGVGPQVSKIFFKKKMQGPDTLINKTFTILQNISVLLKFNKESWKEMSLFLQKY